MSVLVLAACTAPVTSRPKHAMSAGFMAST
jgi:hypothetical protein